MRFRGNALPGSVTAEVDRVLTFAYDDVYSINYFGTKMPPYWRRNGQNASNFFFNLKIHFFSGFVAICLKIIHFSTSTMWRI
jgi:hypothetical protein